MRVNVYGGVQASTFTYPSGEDAINTRSVDSGTIFGKIYNDHSATNITTGAWVELDSALSEQVIGLEIFDSSGSLLELGVGASGSEVPLLDIHPGGNDDAKFVRIASGERLAVRAVSANATSGFLSINLIGVSND